MKGKEAWKVIFGNTDEFYMQKLKRSIERKGDLKVVGMTGNGRKLVELAGETDMDIVLLDTVLHGQDGFWALEQIKKKKPSCICIMITAFDSDNLVRKAIGYGADYYMTKPIQGDLLLERIYQLLDLEPLLGAEEMARFAEDEAQTEEVSYRNLECEISTFLNRMGISASIKGYHFVRHAIMLAVRDEDALIGITKGLYPDIAKEYETSANKVERAIRHAIESAWRKEGKLIYFEAVGYMSEKKPTNGQFIGAMTQYFRLHTGIIHKQSVS